jgi:hypothetical protein
MVDMTTTHTNAVIAARSGLRRRAWTSTGVALLAVAVALTWAVGGTWVTMALLGMLTGVALASSVRHTSRMDRRAHGSDHRRSSGIGGPNALLGSDRSGVLARAVRRELPLMVALCQQLPSGGLPRAGLLAEHTYVAADVLRHLLGHDCSGGATELALERAAVTAQLSEVSGRTGRLYAADRPGGLDHLDWHLARLWVLTEEYLAAGSCGDCHPDGLGGTRVTWSPEVGHLARARVLAFTAVASGADLGSLRRGQALRTRAWLRAGTALRARRRAGRLWGPQHSSRTGSTSAARPARSSALSGRGAA